MLRYRGPSKKTIETVKNFDAFPKIPESYVETSSRGGTISIVTSLLIAFLVISETVFYFDTRFEYDYKVDVEFDNRVWLNFDITVATPCSLIGADVLDITGQASVFENEVVEELTNFQLSSEAAAKREQLITIKQGLVNFEDGKKITEFSLKDGFNATKVFQDRKAAAVVGKANACRFYGHIPLTKVAGNFHIVSGKPLAMFGGHAHLSFAFSNIQYNFSHRIDHLSFGDMRTGFINPLDGDERVSSQPNHIFQYYLEIVSTKINTRRLKTHTYQFSVSELSRPIDHSSGSHGTAGIFFKYDFSPVCVSINEHHIPFSRFLVRLCGIIGGVFATSVIINGIVNCIYNNYKPLVSDKTRTDKSKSGIDVVNDSHTNGLQPNSDYSTPNLKIVPS